MNTDTFAVVPARTRRYGYALQAPPGITWAIGPGRTVGWYRRRRDAQKVCTSLNQWLATRKERP